MSIDAVKKHFIQYDRDNDILEFEISSATVELAAKALGVTEARIAKTLSFKNDDTAILIVTAGDTKIDNKKFKQQFGFKARMLSFEQVLEFTGHEIGGVCPFGLKTNLPIYLDISMKRFESVFPACGSNNSAIELTCEELEEYTRFDSWIDICKNWDNEKTV